MNNIKEHLNISDHIISGTKLDHIPQESMIIEQPRRPRIRMIDEKISEIFVSQSLIKSMFYKLHSKEECPYKVFHCELIRDVKTPETEHMTRGRYFETNCIGRGADDEIIIDLERDKRTGKKKINHIRIDNAIERFKEVSEETGLIVDSSNVQVKMKRLWDQNTFKGITVWIEGTADLISPICWDEYKLDACVIDLKLTSDRDNCMPPFCWGCPSEMDHMQGIMYFMLFELPFFYFVFDYRAKNPGYKILPFNMNVNHPDHDRANQAKNRIVEFHQQMRELISLIRMWEGQGWKKNPIGIDNITGKQVVNCKKCPISDCEFKYKSYEV